jgi:hypothetical protein
MKYTFDSEEFFTARRILWALVFIALGVLIYHAGFTCGVQTAKRHFHRHMMQMHGQQQFNMRMPHGEMGMQMHGDKDVMYYRGDAMMAAPADAGMRVIKMGEGGEDRVLFFKSQ